MRTFSDDRRPAAFGRSFIQSAIASYSLLVVLQEYRGGRGADRPERSAEPSLGCLPLIDREGDLRKARVSSNLAERQRPSGALETKAIFPFAGHHSGARQLPDGAAKQGGRQSERQAGDIQRA